MCFAANPCPVVVRCGMKAKLHLVVVVRTKASWRLFPFCELCVNFNNFPLAEVTLTKLITAFPFLHAI